MLSDIDPIVVTLLAILLLFFGLLFLISLVLQIRRFLWELDYINREIARTTGAERRQWQKEKRRLWRSLLPFCRK